MILVNGPTGSGKSTTLYALLSSLNKEGVNIVSLEDPVEYFISGINQSQMRPEIGYDFASGLRQILRQDPDVIMVGEIRDSETAGLAVHAALTGHVVLSTIHTNNSIGVIPRLIDMKVDPFLLPSALNIMVGQRLVSLICPKCKKAEEAPASVARIIHDSLATLPQSISSKYHEPFQIYHAPGCDNCRNKGVVGRIAIFEILEMTKNLAEIINAGPTGEKILSEARNQGMVNMRADGVLKALDGFVSIEDVIRETTEV
jgi:type II secretory ATPase GspE/PulE/Tfp pilus assembly ATPase PilB-like protein